MANELTEAEVTRAILCRLQDQLNLNPSQCYLVEEIGVVADLLSAGGDYIIQLAPGAIRALQAEGEEYSTVIPVRQTFDVALLTRMQLDPKGKSDSLILDGKRGSAKITGKIIKALLGYDYSDKFASLMAWDSAEPTQYDQSKAVSWRRLSFFVEYDLKLE